MPPIHITALTTTEHCVGWTLSDPAGSCHSRRLRISFALRFSFPFSSKHAKLGRLLGKKEGNVSPPCSIPWRPTSLAKSRCRSELRASSHVHAKQGRASVGLCFPAGKQGRGNLRDVLDLAGHVTTLENEDARHEAQFPR